MTRDNNVPAHPSQNTLLVNSFHGYVVNPDKFAGNPAVQINVAGAKTFLDWLTSPEGQADVASYMSAGGDPAFLPDAAPSVTSSALPAKVAGGKKVTLKGSVANVVPGTPSLKRVVVRLIGTHGGSTFQAAKTVTGAGGRFTLSFTPRRTATYSIHTPRITKVEITTLHPVFGDLLQPTQLQLGRMKVTGGVTMTRVRAASPKVTISGALAPTDRVKAGKVTLFAGHPGRKLHADQLQERRGRRIALLGDLDARQGDLEGPDALLQLRSDHGRHVEDPAGDPAVTAAAGRGSLRAASGGTPRRLARWAAVAALGALGFVLPGPAHAAVDSCADDGPCLVVQVVEQHGDVHRDASSSQPMRSTSDPNMVAHPQVPSRATPGTRTPRLRDRAAGPAVDRP